MENPYFTLHQEFRSAGADVLLSSGQACVAFGIATFSKDGDWIIREDQRSCSAVLAVLEAHRAVYRLGVPLHPDWLCRGLTSHFEFTAPGGFRMRTDFCSRPPRVPDIEHMWACAVRASVVDVVDVESLIRLKQTRRVRDYSMIGSLAEVAGLEGNVPELALHYLQDYPFLRQAVERWPAEAAACERAAVRLLTEGAPRAAVVAAIAVEQDARMQDDEARIAAIDAEYGDYAREFARLRAAWRREDAPLHEQHTQLMCCARPLRRTPA
ncbi:MAG: hypothetical protein FJ278_16985 [Planctomycetes bacterium]|nr:hypothetical protein [Planctomycetota bacterium]